MSALRRYWRWANHPASRLAMVAFSAYSWGAGDHFEGGSFVAPVLTISLELTLFLDLLEGSPCS